MKPETHMLVSVGRFLQRRAEELRQDAEKVIAKKSTHWAATAAMTRTEADMSEIVGDWLIEQADKR